LKSKFPRSLASHHWHVGEYSKYPSILDLITSQHGVKRVRQNKEAIEARKLKEQSKLKDYLALTKDVISLVKPI
jgi:hypothetical protein